MFRSGKWRVPVAVGAASAALVAGLTVGLTGVASASRVHHNASGGVVTYGEFPASPPNYIFPVDTTPYSSIFNADQFFNFMWPPVYPPSPYQPVLDYSHGMANPPVWNNSDTEVTVTLKHFVWSDGTPVTARDMVFFINLARAEGATYSQYAGPTSFPWNLKSYTAVNPTTLRLVLNFPMNPTYFDDNGLSYIYPIPQQAWDKTSVNGAVGNYDMTASGAKAVVTFLQKEAADTTTYSSNPLWKVVDGPWTLQSFGGASSPDIFVPNPKYSGTHPSISEFEEVPFTTDAAEFTALKAHTLDYGTVPSEDIPAIPGIKSEGYNVSKVPVWGFDYIIPNTKNPQVGPILAQTYMRQVLAHLTDQNTMIEHFMGGYAIPTYGPTPVYPKGNAFVSPSELSNPYPYSVSAAEKLLKAHGWQVNPGKVDVCEVAGASGCGAGVTKGEKLSLNLLISNQPLTIQEDADLFQSDASKAGVQINPRSATFNTVIAQVQPCVLPKDNGTPTCNWQLGEYGGISEATYPSGNELLNTGGSFNAGQYSNPTLDKLIAGTTTASSLATYHQYEDLVVKEEPWIWQPEPDNIDAVVSNLTGYGLVSEFDGNVFGYLEPNFWTIK